jgi:hypothetical protein
MPHHVKSIIHLPCSLSIYHPTSLRSKISPPVIPLLPLNAVFTIPLACNASIKLNSIPSHPFAAIRSTVTGRYSTCPVIVELYGASPIGTTKSGTSAITLIRLLLQPNGTPGSRRYTLRGLACAVEPTYMTRDSEQVSGEGARKAEFAQSMKVVLLPIASSNVLV